MSDDLLRCECCQGKKKIIGLGNIEKICPLCSGIGWIAKPKEITKEEIEVLSLSKEPKKRGRKKKGGILND